MMFRTLRGRFVLSHTLPMLFIVLFIGLVLGYLLETHIIVDNLSQEMRGQAVLAAALMAPHVEVWGDPAEREAIIDLVHQQLQTRVQLLDSQGLVLASSDRSDADLIGKALAVDGVSETLAGQVTVKTRRSQRLKAEVIDVMAPVLGASGQILGAMRLTHEMGVLYERIVGLRYVLSAVLLLAILISLALGWIVATQMARPLGAVTLALHELAYGGRVTPIPEQRVVELDLLSRSVDTLVERLHNMEQQRRQLLSNLVHELGRPLGALGSAVQALRGGADQDLALRRDLLAGIDGELARLRRLLDDLAGLHDQVLGSLELSRKPTSLAEWLEELLGPWREAARAKGLAWQARISPSLPTLNVDPDRLAQAVGNLVSNAIRYTPSGGDITIVAESTGDRVALRFSDTGPGIDPQDQALLFTPFFRGRVGRRFPQGMGLGLVIARDLVIAHGGQLEVQSTPGLGSDFTIWLPVSSSS
jgi:two-component system sensor histidine kinase BaeS